MAGKNAKNSKEEIKNPKKGFSTFIGKISGKEELESEIDRLNSQIEKLELDLHNVKTQLEKKEVFVKQAAADKQEAEIRLKQELSRTEALSREFDLLQDKCQDKLKFRETETLSPAAFKAYISKLSSFRAPADDLLTAYLPPGSEISDVLNGKISDRIEKDTLTLVEKIKSETGFAFFYDYHRMICEAVIPPFPITSQAWHLQKNFETSPLEEIFNKSSRIVVLILHAGESFIGFTPDGEFFDSRELVRSSVKEKHSKGGFSQRRFERLREEDIAHHMNKVYEILDKILDENPSIDYVIMSGDPLLIKEIQKRLPLSLETIEKPSDLKLEKISNDEVLRAVLSSRRYLL